jgi:hypothetical protein
MGISTKLAASLLLLAFSAGSQAQESKPWVSAEWTPMTEENDKLFKVAEQGFNIAVEQAREKAEKEQAPDHRPTRKELDAAGVPTEMPSSANGPLTEGGQTANIGPGAANPGTYRKNKNGTRWATLKELMPSSLDFAAPPTGGLILQRTSTSVLFGRTDSEEIVMLPLSGAETDIVHGMRASIKDVNGNLRMLVVLPTGTAVLYEYQQASDPNDHTMSVDIRIGGGPPGTGVEVKRLYRQAHVSVGAPRKAGQ